MNYVYDIEVYQNFFSITFLNIDCDIENISEKDYVQIYIHDSFTEKQIQASILYLRTIVNNTKLLIGYNSINYDNIILDNFIVSYPKLSSIKKLSDSIVNSTYNRYEDRMFEGYKRRYISIDIMLILRLHKLGVSLKQIAILLKHDNIQDLPYPPSHLVQVDEIETILAYNLNDCIITLKLFRSQIFEVKQRFMAQKLYKVDVINSSRSNMANKLMTKFYSDATGLEKFEFINLRTERKKIVFKEIISDRVVFTTTKMQNFLEELKKVVLLVGKDTFEKSVIINNTKYNMMKGGLHSEDKPSKFVSNDKCTFIDADVSSFYPFIIINLSLYPKHLRAIFLEIVKHLTKNRIKAKKQKDNVDAQHEAETLKIVINSIFGKTNDEYSFLKDSYVHYGTTINGQLFLLMLIEALEVNGIQVVSANTDGIVAKVYKKDADKYLSLCIEWSKTLKFDLEFKEYSKYVRLNVNSYMAIDLNGKIKTKNDFTYNYTKGEILIDPTKGYGLPIISIALVNLYAYNIPIDETLRTHTNILNFCMSQKVGKSFGIYTRSLDVNKGEIVIEKQQKNVRFYVSKRGSVLYKTDGDKEISLLKGKYIKILNKYNKNVPIKDYDIDYSFYKAEILKLTNQIEGIDYKLVKSGTGRMFDD